MLSSKPVTGDVIVWCLILAGLVGLMGLGIWLIRRRLFSTPPTAKGDEWSLQQLRDLKSRGDISAEEFEALRSKIIAQYQSSKSGRAENAGGGAGEIGDDAPPSTGENSGVD